MGMEKTNRTTVKAFPRTPQHEQGAKAATEASRYVLQDNHYEQKRSGAWDNLLTEGTGGVEVIAEDKGEEVRLTINQIPWDRIIYDPHSRRKDFSDARFLGQVIWMDFDTAVEKFPGTEDMLESMLEGSTTYDDKPRWMDSIRRRVKAVELYYHKDGEVYYSCFTRGGFLKEPQVSPYKNEEGETEWPYEFASLFVSREGDRYGAINQYLDIQDEINKRRSKALHLMSVRQVRWERGAVEDLKAARQELAKPDGVIETTPGMEFEVLKTGDMAAAQFNLLTEAKAEIDAVGYNAAASGKDTRAMSGVALKEREISGNTELAPMFDVLKHLDKRVYRKVWNRIKQYWTAEKWIRVTDDPQSIQWVGLNIKDPQTGQTMNDMTVLDVDIVISDAPDAVTMQVEEFTAMSEMIKSGFPMPPKAVIMAWPYGNKEQILKMMDEGQKLPPQVEEQMQKMQEEGKKLAEENQQLKADRSIEQAKASADMQAKQADLQLRAQIQSEELRLEREKAEAQIALERAKAEAQVQLQGIKTQADNDAKTRQFEFDGQMQSRKQEFDEQAVSRKQGFEERTKANELMPDEDFKQYYANKVAQSDVMPSLMQGLTQAFSQMQSSLEQIASLQAENLKVSQQTLQAIENPPQKTLSIAGVQKDEFGQIKGATVSTSIN